MIGIMFLILLVMALFRSDEYHYPYCNRTRLDEERKQDVLWKYSQFKRSDGFILDISRNGGICMSGSGRIQSKFSLKKWFKRGFKKHFKNKNTKIITKTAIILASVIVVYQLTGNLLVLGLLGAAFTSKATGNWDAEGQTTWNEAGHPVGGDTVTVQNTHTVTLDSATVCMTLTIDNGGEVTDATNNVGLTVNGTTTVNGTLTGGTATFSFLTLDVNATFTPGAQTVTCNGPSADFTGATITNGGTTNWTLNFATNNCNFTPLYTDEVTPHFYNITVATDTKTITLLGNLCLENQLDVSTCATSGGLTSDAAEVCAFTNSNSFQANPLVLHASATLPAAINLNMTDAYNVPASANYNILYVKSVNTQTATATGTITCTYLYVGDHNAGQECTFDINTRTVTSTGNCLVGNTGGNTRSGYITISTGELQVDGTFTSDVNSSGVVPSGAATLDFNGTVTLNGGTVGANVSWIANWEGNITIAGGTLSAPDNSGSFNFAADYSRTSGTFTHNSGIITLDGNLKQEITSGGQAFNKVVLSGAGTNYYMKDDTELYECDVQASTSFEIDAVSELVGLELSFTDTAVCGFLASAGALVCQGNGSFGVTITSASGAGVTNYWDFNTTMSVTADYTTFEYLNKFYAASCTVDIDNCTFQHNNAHWVVSLISSVTITSFDNNTITAGGYYGLYIEKSAIITNLTLTSSSAYPILWGNNILVEFIDSSFNEAECKYSSGNTNGWAISKNHNDVANDYYIFIPSNVSHNKSDITNDFGASDNVILYTGSTTDTSKLVADEAIANNNFTIQQYTELEINDNITWTTTQGVTVTVNNGGILDITGSSGNLITLRSATPTMEWILTAETGSTVTVSYVDVQDSNATTSDYKIDASDGTNVDSDRNTNWDFGGVSGTGAASSMVLSIPFWTGMIFKITFLMVTLSIFLYTNNFLFIGLLGLVFTSKTSGDWDSAGQTTWNEVGFPASGDTVQINNGHNIRIDSVTGNEACFSCDVQSGGTLTIDDEDAGVISFTFDDSISAGFGTSTGNLVCIGTESNGVIVTSENTPPTNYWDFITSLNITATYTDFIYANRFDVSSCTIDVDNCTFQNFHTHFFVTINNTVTVTSFDNNIITSGIYYGFYCNVGTVITNLTITTTSIYSVLWGNGLVLELIDSNFDETKCKFSSANTNGMMISKNHNDIAGDYYIFIPSNISKNKSLIINDFTSTDNVILYSGSTIDMSKLVADEAIVNGNFTIQEYTELEINAGITWTITQGTTVTVNDNGTLDITGLVGDLITIRSAIPTIAWNLVANNGSTVQVSYVDVQDSDASSGEEIDASDRTSVDSGRNIKWNFGDLIMGGGGVVLHKCYPFLSGLDKMIKIK